MWFWAIAAVNMLAAPGASALPAPSEPNAAGDTLVVKMVDKSATSFVFEPAHVTVHRGDVLEFLQTGSIPHDVVFTKTPSGAKVSNIKVGPMLVTAGQTYDLAIDGRFPAGRYDYECLPHAALGMKGTFTVVPSSAAPASGR